MSDQKQQDGADSIVWVLFGIVLVTLVVGYFFGKDITKVYLTLKLWELKILAFFYATDNMKEVISIIETRPMSEWNVSKVTAVGRYVGWIVNIPLLAILGYMTYKIWKKNPLQYFRRTHDMTSLVMSERVNWPYVTPIIGLSLIKDDINEGPWAMAMKPLTFVTKFKLLDKEKELASLNKTKAEKLFSSQLDKLWESPDKLPKATKALFAIFAAHGCKDVVPSDLIPKELLSKPGFEAKKFKSKDWAVYSIAKIANSAEVGKKIDFSSTDAIFKKYANDPRIIEIYKKHAYIQTVMASMLQFARGTGVLPTSHFLWLRPSNRRLFYTLNCVGRQVSFVEVAGIFSHWKAENVAGHPIEKPFVHKAVEGLEKALNDIKLED